MNLHEWGIVALALVIPFLWGWGVDWVFERWGWLRPPRRETAGEADWHYQI